MRTICLILIGCALLCTIPAGAIPQLPSEFYGTITIDGTPAPAGTIISAQINGQEKGNITVVTAGKYGGPGSFEDRLVVPGEDTDVNQPITFSVNGKLASQTRPYTPGAAVEQLDLTITGQGAQAPVANFVSSGASGSSSSSSGSSGGSSGASGASGASGSSSSVAAPSTTGTTPSTGSQVTGEPTSSAGTTTTQAEVTSPQARSATAPPTREEASAVPQTTSQPTKKAPVPAFIGLIALVCAALAVSRHH